jgi:hypothetical protein
LGDAVALLWAVRWIAGGKNAERGHRLFEQKFGLRVSFIPDAGGA